MSTNTSTGDWIALLRNAAVGVSLAPLFLVPLAGYNITSVSQPKVRKEIEVVSTIPDGNFDFRIAYVRTPQGLKPISPVHNTQLNNQDEASNIPYLLRDITGLPVETLASLANVSRNAYYKWLDGRGVNPEHVMRLQELLDIFRTLHDIRGANLKEFLESPGLAGKPVDLLTAGESSTVIGLAMQSPFIAPTSSNVSSIARDISGLPGWLQSTTRLSWNVPRLTESERDEALDRLNPHIQHNEINVAEDLESDEAFAAWGFFLE